MLCYIVCQSVSSVELFALSLETVQCLPNYLLCRLRRLLKVGLMDDLMVQLLCFFLSQLFNRC